MPDTDSCTPQAAEAPDGSRLTACAHGGHLLGWWPAGGSDQLWLSPMARCAPGAVIRGGVPVVFPQFASRGPLPKHGIARDRVWRLELGAGEVTAELTDTEATRAIWPHRFTLRLRATAAASALRMELAVRNDGLDSFSFTAALHTYLVAEPGAVLYGLDGAGAEDNAAGGTPTRVPSGGIDALEHRDLAVRDLDSQVTLARADGRTLTLERDGFADLVVWHPGADHGLPDVPGPQAPGFVCLEPAQLRPVHLEPAASWRARATMTVR